MTDDTNKRIYFSVSGNSSDSNVLTETHSFYETGDMTITGTFSNP